MKLTLLQADFPDSWLRVRTFLGDPSKSPIGDFRRPYFERKETKRRLSGHKKETFIHLRRSIMIKRFFKPCMTANSPHILVEYWNVLNKFLLWYFSRLRCVAMDLLNVRQIACFFKPPLLAPSWLTNYWTNRLTKGMLKWREPTWLLITSYNLRELFHHPQHFSAFLNFWDSMIMSLSHFPRHFFPLQWS